MIIITNPVMQAQFYKDHPIGHDCSVCHIVPGDGLQLRPFEKHIPDGIVSSTGEPWLNHWTNLPDGFTEAIVVGNFYPACYAGMWKLINGTWQQLLTTYTWEEGCVNIHIRTRSGYTDFERSVDEWEFQGMKEINDITNTYIVIEEGVRIEVSKKEFFDTAMQHM